MLKKMDNYLIILLKHVIGHVGLNKHLNTDLSVIWRGHLALGSVITFFQFLIHGKTIFCKTFLLLSKFNASLSEKLIIFLPTSNNFSFPSGCFKRPF